MGLRSDHRAPVLRRFSGLAIVGLRADTGARHGGWKARDTPSSLLLSGVGLGVEGKGEI